MLAVKVLNSIYFVFNGIFYQQTFGTPMGSPSPIITDIVLQDLETKALKRLSFSPFFFRYVDDVALAASSSCFKHILDTFKTFHPRLQFTMEVGENNKLNFLDVTLSLNNNYIIFY